MYVCMYVYTYIYIYICISIHTHTHTHTAALSHRIPPPPTPLSCMGAFQMGFRKAGRGGRGGGDLLYGVLTTIAPTMIKNKSNNI